MKGFDPKFKDFPDYIIGITKEIWEDRGIATLNHYYAEDIPVRSPMGVQRGNRQVIASTMATCHEFPDRQLFGEDLASLQRGMEDHLPVIMAGNSITHLLPAPLGQRVIDAAAVHTSANRLTMAHQVNSFPHQTASVNVLSRPQSKAGPGSVLRPGAISLCPARSLFPKPG